MDSSKSNPSNDFEEIVRQHRIKEGKRVMKKALLWFLGLALVLGTTLVLVILGLVSIIAAAVSAQ